MKKIITSTGWFGIPGTENRKAKVHMVSAHLPICGARPKGQYQWCSNGANYQYTDCELCRRYYDKYEANRVQVVPTQVITNVGNCARCGGNHLVLTFNRMLRPQNSYTHWAWCPSNQQPILLKVLFV